MDNQQVPTVKKKKEIKSEQLLNQGHDSVDSDIKHSMALEFLLLKNSLIEGTAYFYESLKVIFLQFCKV